MGREISCLVGHSVVLVGAVGGAVTATGEADRVSCVAQLDGLGGVQMTDGDRRCVVRDQVQEPVRWDAEQQHHRRDV